MNKRITILGIPIFFLLPWISYLISLLNLKSKSSAVIFILFSAFFGYSISFSNTSADSYRYAVAFASFERPSSYFNLIQMYIDGQLRDLYRISLFYFTSFFTKNPHVLYAVAGLLYGLVTYLNLRIFIEAKGRQTNLYTFILSIIFITLCSISNVNGFRFNTAAMLAFYSIYIFIIKNKSLGVLGLFLTPLMHYSFFLLIPVILALKLILLVSNSSKKSNPILTTIFIFTFFLSFFLDTNLINISFLTDLNILPGAASNRLSYVNSEDIAELVNERAQRSTFLTINNLFNTIISAYVFIVIIYIQRFIKNNSINIPSLSFLLSFTMAYFSFAFLALSFPSGERFMAIAYMLLIILIARFYAYFPSSKIKKLIFISIIPFSFKILFVNFLLPFLLLTPTFWYGGFIGVVLENLNVI